MSRIYMLVINDEDLGPYNLKKIQEMLRNGSVSIDSFVFDLENNKWERIGDLETFQLLIRKPMQEDNPRYFISKFGIVQGPYSLSYIIHKVKKGRWNYFYYVKENEKDWQLLGEWMPVKSLFPQLPTRIPQITKIEKVAPGLDDTRKRKNSLRIENRPEWVLKDYQGGPFTFLEIMKKIQKGDIKKTHEVRKVEHDHWSIINEVPQFKDHSTSVVLGKDLNNFISRKHDRSSYLGPAIIEFEGRQYSGTCSSIGEGGCFIEIIQHDLKLHAKVRLKILKGVVPLTLEAHGEIVSIITKNPKGMGIEFCDLTPKEGSLIRQFVETYSKQRS